MYKNALNSRLPFGAELKSSFPEREKFMDRELVRKGTNSELSEYIKPDDLVLDVGGGGQPLGRANFVLDYLPWGNEFRKAIKLNEMWPNPYFSEKTWIQRDICARDKWPFEDKQFDFVFCSHTLEDVRDPIWVCREIMRVGKAGYIETPSRIIESMVGIERHRYCGYSHHHWLCEINDSGIDFTFKHAQLHSYSRFHISPGLSFGKNTSKHTWIEAFDPIAGIFVSLNRWFRKINPKYVSVGMYWSGSFQCKEKIILNKSEVEKDFMDFKAKTEPLEDLWVWRRKWFGKKLPNS